MIFWIDRSQQETRTHNTTIGSPRRRKWGLSAHSLSLSQNPSSSARLGCLKVFEILEVVDETSSSPPGRFKSKFEDLSDFEEGISVGIETAGEMCRRGCQALSRGGCNGIGDRNVTNHSEVLRELNYHLIHIFEELRLPQQRLPIASIVNLPVYWLQHLRVNQ